jgi:hypothetical protein
MYVSPRFIVSDITVLPHLVNEHPAPHEICTLVCLPQMEDKDFSPIFRVKLKGHLEFKHEQYIDVFKCFKLLVG